MGRPRLSLQNELTLIAAACALPASAVALAWVWRGTLAIEMKIVITALLLLAWLGGAWLVRSRLMMPLQTAANLIEAVRYGDYSLRGRRARRGDALGDVLIEINQLGETLGRERHASLEANALVQSILAELDAAVFAFDGGGRLKIANRAAAELMGRSSESLLGRNAAQLELAEYVGPDADAAVITVARSFPGRRGRFEIHRRNVREGGTPHTLLVITDLSRALRDEERQAWQKLIRVLGHEINNSLTPIKSLAQTLREMLRDAVREQAASAERRADVDSSLRVIGDRADSLTRFVATYSQLARVPEPAKKPLDLRALVEATLSTPDHADVALLPGPPVLVDADSGQLDQVLINLLRNAREAMASTGGRIEVELLQERGIVQLVIRDEGPGVANPANLFVPFFTTKPGGSGVGLALSRQIIEAHGGSIDLANRRDRSGCIATIELPHSAANAVRTSL